MPTPQDKVQIIKRAAEVAAHNDMATLQHQLTMSEFDGWHRGFKDHEKIIERERPLLFLMGWTLGFTLAVMLLVK